MQAFICLVLLINLVLADPLPLRTHIHHRRNTTTTCPTDLSSAYLVPDYIIPISADEPTTMFGTVFSPIISTTNSTLFGFDIPPTTAYSGTCALLFLFPYGDQAVFEYTFTGTEEEEYGDGGLDFSVMDGSIDTTTTYDTTPTAKTGGAFAKLQIVPGNNYTVGQVACGGGTRMAVRADSVGEVGLTYFQDNQASAIGLYVVPCA